MAFRNSTRLDSAVLMRLFAESMCPWPLDSLTVWVRYTRGAVFSGSCYDGQGRILVNVGRNVVYPYLMGTDIAKSVTRGREWSKPVYTIELRDGYQLALFVFLHECYHWLVKKARRNTRQKESMCDRFAARILVDRFGCAVRDEAGRPVAREIWDFQDLERFLTPALRKSPRRAPRPAVTMRATPGDQLLLFPD